MESRFTGQIRHLRYLADNARRSAERRAKIMNGLLTRNDDLLNLIDHLNVNRTDAATKYHSAVANDMPIAYDLMKLMQNYDGDHRMLTSALRDLAYLLIKYKDSVPLHDAPPPEALEVEEPAWLKDY